MDIRVKKTRSAIVNAFLDLRSKKPLEKITVKELAANAEINKATFYLHFKDIYDLSEFLEREIVENVIKSLKELDKYIKDPGELVFDMTEGFTAQSSLIRIVFEGKQSGNFVKRIEEALKSRLFEAYPKWKNSTPVNVFMSFAVCGAYYAFTENADRGAEAVECIARMTRAASAAQ